jgi:hypothetical protein
MRAKIQSIGFPSAKLEMSSLWQSLFVEGICFSGDPTDAAQRRRCNQAECEQSPLQCPGQEIDDGAEATACGEENV